ncbi:MAG TPA: SLC13 family permease [Bacteroidales bacterium]|nr:SLC13 family permease [Bacteroidales bacterium]
MILTLVILTLSIIFFISGKIRSDLVALCALLALMIAGILTPQEALSGFSNNIVIMMIGLFVVGGAIFQTGLAKKISDKIIKLAGNSQSKLFLLIMILTSSIGAFVSNTGTVALLMPIVISVALGAKSSPSRFLMPLAFASSLGGMMTLIGTPPNLVISNTLKDAGYGELSFFSFLPVGIICVIVGIIVLFPLSKLFLSKEDKEQKKKKIDKSLGELADEYQLSHNLYRVMVNENSILKNLRLSDLNIPQKYQIDILEIRRKSQDKNPFMKTTLQKFAEAKTIIEVDDVLYVKGQFEKVLMFTNDNNLELIETSLSEEISEDSSHNLRFDSIGITELVLMSNSKLVNKRVKDSGFREKYKVNILGIQRSDKYILQDLKDEKMHSGDVLLVQGQWSDIALLNDEQSEWLVVGKTIEEGSKIKLNYKAPIAATIMLLMILSMVFNILPSVTAVMIAAVLMVLSGCFTNVEAAYKTINWESIVLIAAMLPMSIAIEKTGGAQAFSEIIVSTAGGYGPYVVLAVIYFATSLMTMFISNTATAVLFAPIALQIAITIGVNPTPMLFAVAVAASMCFASPFSTPPNALVMSAGRYTFMDYVKVGLPLQLILGIIMIFVLPIIFPF